MPLEEHFDYLSDERRLSVIEDAIKETVQTGDTVADLGCGFGILGLLCLQAGAKHVWGIDNSQALEIARQTVARGNLEAKYSCVHESTYRASLPELVDILVCDHVGCFGIDYGILEMIGDARRLLKPGGKIMPRALNLFAAGIATERPSAQLRSWKTPGVPKAYNWLDEYEANTKHLCTFEAQEICTDAAFLANVDLRSDNPDHFTFRAKLRAACDTEIKGIAGWFECELSENISMTNSPLSTDRISRANIFLPFEQPFKIETGDLLEVSISIRHKDGLIAWTCNAPKAGIRIKQSNWKTLDLSKSRTEIAGEERPSPGITGRARADVFELLNGANTVREIKAAILEKHPKLFPSEDEISKFVFDEIARSSR